MKKKVPHLAATSTHPLGLKIERSEGIYLFAEDGKKYMDMISGIGVSALGHSHPAIKSAIKRQVDKHLHVMVYGEFEQVSQNKAAALLLDLLPDALDTVYFVNSGAEANELALKLAKRVTGRRKLVSFLGAYHGNTHGALSVSANESKKSAFQPLLPEVEFIRLNHYSDLQKIDEYTAAVILETIQGDAGVRIPDKEYMLQLSERCKVVGALLILDEIQCGLGRAGRNFAFEYFGIVPDILSLGKSLGGGMPIGAVVSSHSNMSVLTHHPELGHITTFGGHPVVCASAAAFLKVYCSEIRMKDVCKKGKRIKELLKEHQAVVEIRQIGLFFAIEMRSADEVQQVVEFGINHGLISFWFLSCPHAFRIAPPLNISNEELEKACAIILQAFDTIR